MNEMGMRVLDTASVNFCQNRFLTYRKISNMRRTLVGNNIVDQSDVVGASPVGAAPTTSSFFDLTSGFKGFGKDSRKPLRESFKNWNLVRLMLANWR